MANEYKLWANALSSDSKPVIDGIGKNIIPQPKKRSLWLEYFDKFKDPIITILCVILVLSCIVTVYEISHSHDYNLLFEPAGILLAILLSTGIGFYFEVRANKEFSILNKVNDENLVKVIRRSTIDTKPSIQNIKKCDVVKGDLVRLEGGDEVPADGYIIEGEGIRVDESAYTGEPYTMKFATASEGKGDEAYEKNFLLRGSIILEGACYMVVSAVGAESEEGKGAIKMQSQEDIETPLNHQLGQLGSILTKASYIIAGLILVGRLLFLLLSGNVAEYSTIQLVEYILSSIMIAVTLIVVAVPEGLPMSVTVSLALSMRKMLKAKNLVRKLHACETMGATTVICTDKTGTLTQNKMVVVKSSFLCDQQLVANAISINTTAELTIKEDGSIQGIGNPTEISLLQWIRKEMSADYMDIRSNWKVLDREPFSTETKYMSTTAESLADGSVVKFIKGAPEIILAMASMSQETRLQYTSLLETYQSRAMRTLAFACQKSGGEIELMGIVGIADPVRDGVKDAIKVCHHPAGVRVIMVTGDVSVTAMEIGRQLSLISDNEDGCCITGAEFAQMTDDQIIEILPSLKVLSRARPDDKARLVELLQRTGEVVAVTGDGTNDAMALKRAQVGLSMGDGTARAKEVSDITILDNSFSSINNGILWGRSLYQNIKRFILFQMTINVCACLVVLIGAFTGVDSPLTVTQMLWVNLIMDTFAAMALSSLPADKIVMKDKPRNPQSHIIDRSMLNWIIATGVFFFIFLTGFWQLLWHVDVSSVKDLLSWDCVNEYFRGFFDTDKAKTHVGAYESGIFFTTFVLLQFWNLFNARYFKTDSSLMKDISSIITGTKKFPECFSKGFILISLVIVIGQIVIVNCAGNFFNVAPLSINDWFLILICTSPIFIIPDIVRSIKIAQHTM